MIFTNKILKMFCHLGTFSAGQENAKEALQEIVILPSIRPEVKCALF